MPQQLTTDDGIELGDVVRDSITGIEGVVTNIAYHISGCKRYAVQPFDSLDLEDTKYTFGIRLDVVEAENVEAAFDVPDPEGGPTTECHVALGDKVEDDLTGLRGIVTVVNFTYYNCPRVCVQPTGTETTESPESEFFDAPRLSVLEAGAVDEYDDLQAAETEASTGAAGMDMVRKADMG